MLTFLMKMLRNNAHLFKKLVITSKMVVKYLTNYCLIHIKLNDTNTHHTTTNFLTYWWLNTDPSTGLQARPYSNIFLCSNVADLSLLELELIVITDNEKNTSTVCYTDSRYYKRIYLFEYKMFRDKKSYQKEKNGNDAKHDYYKHYVPFFINTLFVYFSWALQATLAPSPPTQWV